MIETIASIIGSITGVISLLGIIYLIAYWKGGIDTWKRAHEEEHRKYPPAEIAMMCKTLWDIYVVDALRTRPDLAEHHSAYKLTPNGEDLIPDDMKTSLSQVKKNPIDPEALASGWLVVKEIGMERIETLAKQKNLNVPETIAILSTFLENHINHH